MRSGRCYHRAVPRSDARPRVLVIVPAWNEQESVGATVDEIRATNPSVDVLVVDDGSGDRTADGGGGGRRLGGPSPVQPRRRRCHAHRLPARPAVRVRRRGADRRRRPARPALPRGAGRRARPRRHLHRQPLRPRRRPVPRPRPPPLGDVPPGPGPEPAGRHHADRRHLGLPRLQPPRDDRLRRALPGRVPRRHRRVPRHRDPGRLPGGPAAGRHAPPRRRHARAPPRCARRSSCAVPWSALGLALVRPWPATLRRGRAAAAAPCRKRLRRDPGRPGRRRRRHRRGGALRDAAPAPAAREVRPHLVLRRRGAARRHAVPRRADHGRRPPARPGALQPAVLRRARCCCSR